MPRISGAVPNREGPLHDLKTSQVKDFFDTLLPLFGEALVDPTGIEG